MGYKWEALVALVCIFGANYLDSFRYKRLGMSSGFIDGFKDDEPPPFTGAFFVIGNLVNLNRNASGANRSISFAKNPTRISILTGFCPRQPSHEKESQGQLQPREGGFDGRLEVF
ncbi:hypothetical protein K9U33_20245 [Rhodoblastus acidophilus]|nr:hypothetical protein [Candidatus Rhodoblastus alkanivorans]